MNNNNKTAIKALEAALQQQAEPVAVLAEPVVEAVSDDCTPNHFCGYRWVHKPFDEICSRCGHE